MTRAKTVRQDFWHSRQGYGSAALIGLLAMYLIASRAIETGSLQQYFLTFLFLGITINRLIKFFRS